MAKRADQKAQSRRRIVDAAAKRFLTDGLEGATIAAVLGDADLTHGAFYAHFRSKEAMLAEAFLAAAAEASDRWVKGISELPTNFGLSLLLARNLGPAHLHHPEIGCPFVAAGAEVWRSDGEIREAYQAGMLAVATKVAEALGDGDTDRALAIHATCIGALTMARSVASEEVALRVMRACRQFLMRRNVPREQEKQSEGDGKRD